MSQLSLFGVTSPKQESRSPPTQIKKPPRYRVPLENHKVKDPWGEPDKNGKFFYEKLRNALSKLPIEHQEFFNHITQLSLPEHLDGLEKCLRMLRMATEYDRIDWDESRGRL